MKRSDLSKVIGAGVLGLSLALVPLTMPSYAQTGGSGTGGATGTSGTTTDGSSPADTTTQTGTDTTTGDRDFDWGWLGLLGLAGLGGLAGRKREEPARYREPDEVGRTGTRY
ncbi:MAG: hypothetical protein KME08_16435 [Aphanothece sp. CMT-3BRIN-NPC111]|jgi:hypothetical protein|nr:hypothetical protein [Aphanothece sp. CMT-3BRIN-NPC111]